MELGEKLHHLLGSIDGQSYNAYKGILGKWYDMKDFQVGIPYVQGDPFAKPSKVFLRLTKEKASFPPHLLQNKVRRIALGDFITRLADKNIKLFVKGKRGLGKSGLISIAPTSQEVLERTSLSIGEEFLEMRLNFGLPAQGRRVLGYQARDMFFQELPQLVKGTLYYKALHPKALEDHVYTVEDQHFLRNQLEEKGLVAFIGNGSILPRRSGVDDRPLKGPGIIPFMCPLQLKVKFQLPHRGLVEGMGIKKGITLIVGGGYHGKSTLLRAIERGVYNHLPGDGRELVVTQGDGMKIPSEDGRRVEKVDISPFIQNLPQGVDTTSFSTENASGSTSQAANIMEALEMGTKLLLMDEDTCATNFMLRDVRMQHLVKKEKEPITPFLDKVKPLYRELMVSTILVLGGAGDYFDVADQVIMMDGYLPRDVTLRCQEIRTLYPSKRLFSGGTSFGAIPCRYPLKESIDPKKGKRVKVKSRGQEIIQFGQEDIQLGALEQIISWEQTKAIGDLLLYAIKENLLDGERNLKSILLELEEILDREGLEVISPFLAKEGDYARPRPFEVGGALNRLRTLKVKI